MTTHKLKSTVVTAAVLLMISSFAGVSADTYEYHHQEERHEYSSQKAEFREHHEVRVNMGRVGHDVFMTHMDGGQEAPNPGDPDGRGIAVVHLNRNDENKVCTFLKVKGIAKSTAAHIHKAPRGQAGPVVLPIPAPDDRGKASGCVDVSRELIKEIAEYPDQFYVNVHTGEYPDGAVRGQLR